MRSIERIYELKLVFEIRGTGGADPLVRAGRLVPQPTQRHQHLAGRQQADGGVGGDPGGPPHQSWRTSFSWDFAGRRPIQTGQEAYPTAPASPGLARTPPSAPSYPPP